MVQNGGVESSVKLGVLEVVLCDSGGGCHFKVDAPDTMLNAIPRNPTMAASGDGDADAASVNLVI